MRRMLMWLAVIALGTACGGRTGLRGLIDVADDASAHDAGRDTSAVGDGSSAGDGHLTTDATTDVTTDATTDATADAVILSDGYAAADGAEKTCGGIMLCALHAGSDYRAMLECARGGSWDGVRQSADVLACLVTNCYTHVVTDGGGTVALVACLVQHCKAQLCACVGIQNDIPAGLLHCS
jgi:hypothetical protein